MDFSRCGSVPIYLDQVNQSVKHRGSFRKISRTDNCPVRISITSHDFKTPVSLHGPPHIAVISSPRVHSADLENFDCPGKNAEYLALWRTATSTITPACMEPLFTRLNFVDPIVLPVVSPWGCSILAVPSTNCWVSHGFGACLLYSSTGTDQCSDIHSATESSHYYGSPTLTRILWSASQYQGSSRLQARNPSSLTSRYVGLLLTDTQILTGFSNAVAHPTNSTMHFKLCPYPASCAHTPPLGLMYAMATGGE